MGASGDSSSSTGVGGDPHDHSVNDSGAAYVFTRVAGRWSQQAYIKASNPDNVDGFGAAVSLSGETLAVGAHNESSAATGVSGDQADNSAPYSGAVYVFTRSGDTWTQQAYLKASVTDPGDEFGRSLALSGNMLAVGAYREASAATGLDGDPLDNTSHDGGAVYTFNRTGDTWSQQHYVKATNTDAGDWFGWSVALAGQTLAVTASLEASAATGVGGDQTDNSAAGDGAVYVYRL